MTESSHQNDASNPGKALLKIGAWVTGLDHLDKIVCVLARGIKALTEIRSRGEKELAEARKRFLDETVKPAYVELAEIHADYMDVCENAVRGLPFLLDGQWHGSRGTLLTADEARRRLAIARNELQIERQRHLGQRTALRRDAEQLLADVTEDPYEGAFMYAVLNYFLRMDGSGMSLRNQASKAEMIGRLGVDATLGTPSSYWVKALGEDEDAERLRDFFLAERTKLSEYWSDVTCRYRDLRRAYA